MRVLKWIILAPIFALIGLMILGSLMPPPKPSQSGAHNEVRAIFDQAVELRKEVTAQIQVAISRWTVRSGRVELFGTIVNRSSHVIKDVELTCKFYASSGSLLETKRSTVYEVFLPSKPIQLNQFFVGYAPDQSKTARCDATWFWYEVGKNQRNSRP